MKLYIQQHMNTQLYPLLSDYLCRVGDTVLQNCTTSHEAILQPRVKAMRCSCNGACTTDGSKRRTVELERQNASQQSKDPIYEARNVGDKG